MKKIGTVAAAAGLFAATAMPAFADVNVGVGNGNALQTNLAPVVTTVSQGATTGSNFAGCVICGSNVVSTGSASNVAVVGTSVNSHSGMSNNVNIGLLNGNKAQTNIAPVSTTVAQGASTGGNAALSAISGANGVVTGSAFNGASVVTMVNSSVN